MHVTKLLALMFAVMLFCVSSVCMARQESASVDVNGVQRSYRLFVPERSSTTTSYPLVFDLHGTGGTPEGQSRNSALTGLAAQHGFIVVHPVGMYVRAANSGATWNVDLDPHGIDDVEYIRAIVTSLQKRYSIDPQRIYATGFSGGARMSSRLACDMSTTFAAVALVGGVRFPEKCSPTQPVAVLAIHAEDDQVNHFEHRPDSPPYWPVGVMDAIGGWVRQNQCDSTPRRNSLATDITKLSFERCAPGGDVVLITSKQGGHSWPGSPTLKPEIAERFHGLSATEELWRFFASHPKHEVRAKPRESQQ